MGKTTEKEIYKELSIYTKKIYDIRLRQFFF